MLLDSEFGLVRVATVGQKHLEHHFLGQGRVREFVTDQGN